jgi:hypothetical protein
VLEVDTKNEDLNGLLGGWSPVRGFSMRCWMLVSMEKILMDYLEDGLK